MVELRGRTAELAAAAVLTAASLSGCSAGEPAVDTVAGSSSSPSVPRPHCPNLEGGVCLGALEADRDYSTQRFHPTITYRVPEAGWFNYEDTPGNFLLVPPGSDLPGVNAGTSDFIGVYTAIAPSQFAKSSGCVTSLVPGIAATPDAVAAWIQDRPSLEVTPPAPVEVGGLDGVVVDIRATPGKKLPMCQVGNETVEVALLFSGVQPSSLDHGVIEDMTMRLYLLGYQDKVLAVEVDDIDSAPTDLDTLAAVVDELSFST